MQTTYTTYCAEITTIINYKPHAGYRRKVQPDTYIPRTEIRPSFRRAWEQLVRRMAEYGLEEVGFTIHSRATNILPRREICNVLRGSRSKLNGPEIKAARMALSEIYGASQNRQLMPEEDVTARRLIREIHRNKPLAIHHDL